MSKESTVSPLPVLLGFLTPGPRHPYELYQEFDRELGEVWHIGQSHFYAYLKQLARAGLVSVKTETQPNRPARTVYQLMTAGHIEFLNWLQQPTSHVRHIRLEFMTRLYFFHRFGLPGLPQLIADQEILLQSHCESLERAIGETEDAYWRQVLEFRKREIQAIVGWLHYCLGDEK